MSATIQENTLDPARVEVLHDVLGDEGLSLLLAQASADIASQVTMTLGIASGSDTPALGRQAHALAGVAMNIGAVELAAAARSLERLCPAAHRDEIARAVPTLQGAAARAICMLDRQLSLLAKGEKTLGC